MKVLFLVYPHIGLHHGGLQVQIENTAKALQKLGVKVLFYDPWKNDIPNVDVCHSFGFDASMRYHLNYAFECGKKIVISPVFNMFSQPRWFLLLEKMVAKSIPGMLQNFSRFQNMLEIADKVLPLNTEEALLLKKIGLKDNKTKIVPNGINLEICNSTDTLAINRLGLKNYVLQVGSIEKRKNQLALIEAASLLPKINFVLVGNYNSRTYFEKCKKKSGKNILFTGEIGDKSLLYSIYKAAKVFVLPSFSEVMPLTLYEAAIAGCNLVVSKKVPVEKKILNYVKIVSPYDISALARCISESYHSNRRSAADIVASFFTWEDVANELLHIYNS